MGQVVWMYGCMDPQALKKGSDRARGHDDRVLLNDQIKNRICLSSVWADAYQDAGTKHRTSAVDRPKNHLGMGS